MQIILTMKMETIHISANRKSIKSIVFLLLSLFTSLPLFAQEVTVQVTPVQQVLPPQAGQYIDNPGRFFTIRLINNTDQVQQLHLGLQLEQRYPEQGLWVSTNVNNNHIPRQPIVLQPNQHKTLNSIESKHLLDHFAASDFFIREGSHFDVTDGSFGLMPEGEYELFLTAYKWDPELTSPVVLSDPKGGNTLFNICYAAQPPSFIQPMQPPVIDGLTNLEVLKINKNMPTFQWTAPTLNCNFSAIDYKYQLRVVELVAMSPDEAMQENTITFYEKNTTSTSLTLPTAYVNQMIGATDSVGKVYALQVTASNSYQSQNVLNFSLLENDGKSPIILFQLYDPNYKPKKEKNDSIDISGNISLQVDTIQYTFDQPLLTRPQFAGMTGRKVYMGDSIKAEWKRANLIGGYGQRQDTIQFKYTVALYTGNSADSRETIFKSKPIYKNEKDIVDEYEHVIKWDKLKDKVKSGDYFYLRITAKAKNIADSVIKIKADSLNFINFAIVDRFNEDYQCGSDYVDIANKTPLTTKPGSDKDIKIGEFYLTFNDGDAVKKEDDNSYTGTGWIRWNPQSDNYFNMNARVAVKFEKLKVNTSYEVYDGKCQTYSKSSMKVGEYTADQFVDAVFSSDGLSDIFGTLGLDEGVAEKISNYTNMGLDMAGQDGKDMATNLAQSYNLGKYYSYYRKGQQLWNDWKKGDVMDLYFPVELPSEIKSFLPKDFSVQIASIQFTPKSAQMNLIAEVALPNSDVFDGQDVLIFGAPRLCISPDQFFPDEGVLALLSNFPLKDPSSDFKRIFKAPSDPLDPEPDDGCFLRWANGEFGGLGLEIAAAIPNTNRIMDGKVKKDVPALLDLKTVIRGNDSAGDFIATGTLTPFEVKDLPGWSFHVGDEIVFDHNMSENDVFMPTLDEIRKTFSANIAEGKKKDADADKDGDKKGKSKEVASTFDPKQCGTGVEADWNAWQGVFIKNVSVGFPKFSVLGGNKEGVQIGAKNMIIDGSGVTCQVFTDSLLTAETASVGGWKFSIDHAAVDIVQNNFDNCTIQGGIGVPLFKAKPKKDDKKDGSKTGDKSGGKTGDKSGGKTGDKSGSKTGNTAGGTSGGGKDGGKKGDGKDDKKAEHQETDIRYTCEIRHLTDPTKDEKYYTWHEKRDKNGLTVRDEKGAVQYEKIEHTRRSYGDQSRYAYIFTTEEIGDLDFSCFIAEATLTKEQTYFVVEAEDNLETGDTDTRVELCVGGEISIGGIDSANEHLQELGKSLNIPLKIPGVHFAKMRLSNKKRNDWHSTYASVKRLQDARDAYDKKWAKDNHTWATLMESEEIEITKDCYFDLGEWSLASAKKKIGPFSFNINEFKPGYSGGNLTLDINGSVGLVDDIICVGGGVTIAAKVDIADGLKDISVSDGDVKFRELSLDLDFTDFMHFAGKLECIDKDDKEHKGDKGYKGNIDIEITGLFGLKCEGGFFEHEATDADMEEKKTAAQEKAQKEGRKFNEATDLDQDRNYSWGYFKASATSELLRVDPVVINRIAGGFYFNCRPTPGDSKEDKFGGTPKAQYGMIGVALGVGLTTTAGEETIQANVDLLVVYDRHFDCLSTLTFKGDLKALSGIIDAKVCLVYENSKDLSGKTIERYLSLNVTAEAGISSESLKEKILSANGQLEKIQATLNDFQKDIEDVVEQIPVGAPMSDLGKLAGNYESNDDKTTTAESTSDKNEFKAGQISINLEFKITWKKKDQPAYTKPLWHLYIGEPELTKRCTFTILKFKSKICSVDIGANGYLCIGNELPNNGALPPIPPEILEFLGGKKVDGVDMGANAQEAEQSRAKAVKAMLNTADTRGGVMVGASCWGNIDIDLGLIYGGIHSLAGFDASLVNYGANAICVNTGSGMGYNGWYAMGQLYALLEAKIGIRIKIGKLINEDVPLLYAGIGGLLEMGLPNPSWVEGKLRVKMNLLSGLVKIDKKFSFSAGDHCVPFVGNALDGFEMFQNVSHGSDSLYQALYKPEFAISKTEASHMTFSTNTSLGTHYRLVDPSYKAYTGNDSTLNMHNSRTYVFDMNKDKVNGMKMGVRLFDLGVKPTQMAGEDKMYDEDAFSHELQKKDDGHYVGRISNVKDKSQMARLSGSYPTMTSFLATYFDKRENTTAETSTVMNSKDINSSEKRVMEDTGVASYIDYILDNNVNSAGLVMNDAVEVPVSFREDKGTQFHLTGMNLKPGHSYMLVLFGDAYEIKNGRKQWVEYYNENENGKYEYVPIKWKQSKLWFFRVKSDAEDKIETDSLRDLTPYVALAYPSVDGTRVTTNPGEPSTTAYIGDILHPTIALNRNLQTALPQDKMKWTLNAYKASEPDKRIDQQTVNAIYKTTESGNCINIEPERAFTKFSVFKTAAASAAKAGQRYSFSDELYNLQLNYTYKANGKDSVVCLVNLWLTAAPHDVTVNGKSYDDSWLESTNSSITGQLLPYAAPFVGARPWQDPTVDYKKVYSTLNTDSKRSEDFPFVFNNHKNISGEVMSYNNLPMRLVDPYLYLAYLSKWTFIADRAISKYDFDDVEIPFGSESLTFQKGSTLVNAVNLLNDKGNNMSLFEQRTVMDSICNTWAYANKDLPKYPLPMTQQTVGGITTPNQDERASTIRPLNVNYETDYTLNLSDLVKDYAAPYDVASQICSKLKKEAQELYDCFIYCLVQSTMNNINFNTALNGCILNWNKLHRGQYLQATVGDVTAKVPYYQLPLIFGDCFGHDVDGKQATFKGIKLDHKKRSFGASIGANDLTGERWKSEASNLLFFRLTGNQKTPGMMGVPGQVPEALMRYKSQHNSDYLYPASDQKGMQVSLDSYDANTGLKAVNEFKARIYRVNTYNISTGLYTLNDGVGASPRYKDVAIDKNNGKAKNLNDMYGVVKENEAFLASHYDTPQPHALYDSGNRQLTLLRTNDIIEEGDDYNGLHVTRLWVGDDCLNGNWQSSDYTKEVRRVTKVVVDPSFKEAEITSTKGWFAYFSYITGIDGIENLNTEKTTDMSSMFTGCGSITDINLNKLDVQNVETMRDLFYSCANLKTVDMGELNAKKLTDVTRMFYICPALNTVNLTGLEGKQVTDCKLMFYECKALQTLSIQNFSPLDVETYNAMFTSVPSSLKATIHYRLDERIKSQIPGQLTQVGNPNRAIMANDKDNNLVFVLMKATDGNNPQANKTFTVKAGGTTYSNLKVVKQWTADAVLRSAASSTWGGYSNRTSVKKVIIDDNFTDAPENIEGWFKGFSNLEEIVGLTTLNTSKATSMKELFSGCTKLKVLDLSNFTTGQVTNMSAMFYNCNALKELDIWNFKTDNVTTMSSMFMNCNNLTNLSASLHTGKVTSMSSMFEGCSKLQNLDEVANKFSTGNVTTMYSMFRNCRVVKTLDLIGYNTEKVTDMSYMFAGCTSLDKLKLNEFTSEKLASATYMFNGTKSSCTVWLPYDIGIKVYPTQIHEGTFPNLKLVHPAQVLVMDNGGNGYKMVFLSNRTKYGDTYSDGSKIYRIYKHVMSNPSDSYMGANEWQMDTYNGSNALTKIKKVVFHSSFASVQPITTASWFEGMTQLTTIEGMEYLNTSDVTMMDRMFRQCSSLKEINLSSLNTANVKNMERMFEYCSKLKSVNLSLLNKQKLESIQGMFTNCTALESVSFGNFNAAVFDGDFSRLFEGCQTLKSVDLSAFKDIKVTAMDHMFENCTSLERLDLSMLNTTGCTTSPLRDLSMLALFKGCKALKQLIIGPDFHTVKNNYEIHPSLLVFDGVTDMAVKAPAEQRIEEHLGFVNHLGFIDGDHGWFEGLPEEQTQSQPVAQAIWTADNETLTFYYGKLRNEGETYGGKTVTKVWSGTNVTNKAAAWRNSGIEGLVKTVVFDKSFATVKPQTMQLWFNGFKNMTSIVGMENLNVSEVKYMADLFHDCSSLTSIDLSHFNTANVTAMNNMFTNCKALTELNLSTFNTQKVTSATNLFYGCSGLKMIKVGSGFTFSAMSTKAQTVFTSVPFLLVIAPSTTAVTTLKATLTNKLGWTNSTGHISVNTSYSPYALWVADQNTLYLVRTAPFVQGDYIWRGKTVTNVWSAKQNSWSGVKSKIKKVIIEKSFSEVEAQSTASWFQDCTLLSSVDGLAYLNTNNVKSMFQGCTALVSTSINVSKLNLQDVTSMASMFQGCTALKSVTFGSFDSSKVKSMASMFQDCTSLATVNMSGIPTENVTDMSSMFRNCGKLTTLTHALKMGNVTTAASMFYHCGLKSVTLGTSLEKVTTTSTMFEGCPNLTSVTMSFDMPANTTMQQMFKDCENLTTVARYSNWEANTKQVKSMKMLLYNCKSLTSVPSFQIDNATDLSSMFRGCAMLQSGQSFGSPQNVTSMADMFYGCAKLSYVTFRGSVKNVTDMSNMFYGCSSLSSVSFANFDATKLTTTEKMFSGCSNLTSIVWKGNSGTMSTPALTNMRYMFYNCKNITKIDLSGFNTSNVTDMSALFNYCEKLTDVTKTLNTSKVTTMASMFAHCKSLTFAYWQINFNTSKVTDMKYMFYQCEAATTLTFGRQFNTAGVTDMSYMFSNCKKLTDLGLSVFNTQNVTTMNHMFSNCSMLGTLIMTNFNTKKVTDMGGLLYNCTSLQSWQLGANFSTTAVTKKSSVFTDVKNLWVTCPEATKTHVNRLGFNSTIGHF